MENVTIRMLAERLQLSTATISKALSNSHEISEETKQRVLALASELNYVPNPYASSLRKKSSNTIAVVIPEVADSFFAEAINGIEWVAQEKGYHVLIYLTHENFGKEQAILKDFQSGRVDGVLISVTTETAAAQHGLDQLVKKYPSFFSTGYATPLPLPKSRPTMLLLPIKPRPTSLQADAGILDCYLPPGIFLSATGAQKASSRHWPTISCRQTVLRSPTAPTTRWPPINCLKKYSGNNVMTASSPPQKNWPPLFTRYVKNYNCVYHRTCRSLASPTFLPPGS